MQGFEVDGPVILSLNTNQRQYRPGDLIQVMLTARGETAAQLKLYWDNETVAYEGAVGLAGLTKLDFELVAPEEEATYLIAEFVGEVTSHIRAYVHVRA